MALWTAASRQLRRRSGFALATIFLIGASVAANTTVFSLVWTVLLKPLPYPNPEHLVTVFEANTAKSERTSLIAPARLEDWRRQNKAFAAIAAAYSDAKTDRTGTVPERLRVSGVSRGYFDVYQVRPAIGRTFTAAEETYGGPNVVILSDQLWRRRFGATSNAIGKRLLLDKESFAVIGVMPPLFESPNIDVWMPAPLNPYLAKARDARFLHGVGRLKPGVSTAEAQRDLYEVQKDLGKIYPQTDAGWSATVTSLKTAVVGGRGKELWVALAAVATLLLLVCTNLAALVLGAMNRRQQELALRASLGATRWQMIAGLVGEISPLLIVGSLVGIVASTWCIAAARVLLSTMPRMDELQLEWPALLFTAVVCAGTVALVALAPAWQGTRRDPAARLTGGRTETGTRHRAQELLMMAQFAITVLLLVGAGLLLRSYARLSTVEAGFRPEHAYSFHLAAGWSEDRAAIGNLQRDLIASLEQSGGVGAAGMTNFLPTDEATLRYQYAIDGITSDDGTAKLTAGSRTVSGGYLRALRIPVVAGASCSEIPSTSEPPRALVNQAFLRRFAVGRNLIGRRLHIKDTGLDFSYEISGVVGDVREDSMRLGPTPYVYACSFPGGWPDPVYVLRTDLNEAAASALIRKTALRLAPGRAVSDITPMEAHVSNAIAQPRLTAEVIAAFAAAALLIAACGLYSTCSLVVSSRTREIGTRMALGAHMAQVVRPLFARAVRFLALGALTGAAMAIAAGTVMRSLLFEVDVLDLPTLACVALGLASMSLLAMTPPALRAASVDPVDAMREQ